MKEALKKVLDKSILAVITVLILFVIIFEYIVFPGLTVADTFINIISFLVGLLSFMFIYHFIQWRDMIDFILGKKEETTIGETELDYSPNKNVTKKRTVVKKPTTKKVITETKSKK